MWELWELWGEVKSRNNNYRVFIFSTPENYLSTDSLFLNSCNLILQKIAES
ncbi:MAG: hypothetical protein F6K40_08435 [Okeania sp. SIO3I5]|uniref:hypothetical protein n=1 Tax=Okeania sp. SIO3I5 TaxID=2607805 RepID=UPI0013B90E9E|nr:hypothetical protein [Okeania sp. SIO3I5]NEQ36307.1 hypothetical protein [Okeania sp. SIO3I5]